MKPWLCLFPTKMKVFETSCGRDSKPLTASDAAAYRLMILTLMSFSSSDRERESGPSFACATEYADGRCVSESQLQPPCRDLSPL